MEHRTHTPVTPAGAPVTTCDLDENCADLDCDAVMDEFGGTLLETSVGQDFLAHYCGLDYMDKLPGQGKSEG
jgi:hypothetical protein